MSIETCIIDNRTFLLGLDELYRQAMKKHERGELLSCARNAARVLSVQPDNTIPVEGYYYEDEQLTEYFRLVRTLQRVGAQRVSEVEGNADFRRLREVTSAPIFGQFDENSGGLLPRGRDPLTVALDGIRPWTIDRIVEAAHKRAAETDDFSLVGLAALSKDAVVLTALRESVVLYVLRSAILGIVRRPEREYVWQVSDAIAKRAQKFISTFNRLFNETLPDAIESNARYYWQAGQEAKILGRCVCLGDNYTQRPVTHYHWAIKAGPQGFEVSDFWDTVVWTTERFRQEK